MSVHAPSQRVELSESELFEQLESLAPFVDGIVVHPDLIIEVDNWKVLGERAYIENMDNRKPIGRTVDELQPFFDALPAARFCLDLGHAWQIDPTMRLATELLHAFHSRLAELHISEVDADSRHRPISSKAANDFRAVAELIPENIPAIIESEVQHDELQTELRIVQFALGDVDSIEAS